MQGPLKNARHERFAQAIARGECASTAYKLAGYSATGNSAEAAASRLLSGVKVRGRVLELKKDTAEKVTEKTAIDAAWVLEKAAELHAKALEEKQLSVAKGCLDLIGKHIDVQAFREQMLHSGRVEYVNMSDEEVEARIVALIAGKHDRPSLTTH